MRRKLDNEAVQAARLVVAGGLTVRETATKLGLSFEALKRRASREKWLQPKRAAKAAEKRATERANELHATSFMERGASYERHLATAAEKFALKAAAMDAEELLNRAGSVERLDKVGRRVFRLDREKDDLNQVNIAILGSIGSPTDYETSTMEAQTNYENT